MLAFLALALPAQTVSTGDPMHKRLHAIGERLKCSGGSGQCSCPYTVASCNMLHCESREEIEGRIKAGLAAGQSEETILANLKEKYGTLILTAPPAQGFNLVGWIMPFIALVLGLIVIRYILKRWRRPQPAPAGHAPHVDRFRDEIEKELADSE